MRKKRAVLVVGLVLMVFVLSADAGKGHVEKSRSGQLPAVTKAIDKAIAAIKSGDDKTALAELQKAKTMIAAIEKGHSGGGGTTFANKRCPIMGSPINPAKVGKNLVRDYKGEKVAFCCGGCPGKWDKLSDSEKDVKLSKVK